MVGSELLGGIVAVLVGVHLRVLLPWAHESLCVVWILLRKSWSRAMSLLVLSAWLPRVFEHIGREVFTACLYLLVDHCFVA